MAPPKRVQDVLDQLLDARDVADLLGLTSDAAVRAYASQFPDFPEPVLPQPGKGSMRSTLYWYRPDIVRWRKKHPGRSRPSPGVTPPP